MNKIISEAILKYGNEIFETDKDLFINPMVELLEVLTDESISNNDTYYDIENIIDYIFGGVSESIINEVSDEYIRRAAIKSLGSRNDKAREEKNRLDSMKNNIQGMKDKTRELYNEREARRKHAEDIVRGGMDVHNRDKKLEKGKAAGLSRNELYAKSREKVEAERQAHKKYEMKKDWKNYSKNPDAWNKNYDNNNPKAGEKKPSALDKLKNAVGSVKDFFSKKKENKEEVKPLNKEEKKEPKVDLVKAPEVKDNAGGEIKKAEPKKAEPKKAEPKKAEPKKADTVKKTGGTGRKSKVKTTDDVEENKLKVNKSKLTSKEAKALLGKNGYSKNTLKGMSDREAVKTARELGLGESEALKDFIFTLIESDISDTTFVEILELLAGPRVYQNYGDRKENNINNILTSMNKDLLNGKGLDPEKVKAAEIEGNKLEKFKKWYADRLENKK